MSLIESTSILSVPLAIKSHNGNKLGTATGFFWRKSDGRTYLVSNHHVFTGNHYVTNLSLRQDSAFPGFLDYPRFVSPQSLHERQLHTIQLCDEAGNDPTWRAHPIHNNRPVDLAIIEVPTIADDQSYVYAVNDEPRRDECAQHLRRYPPGFELIVAGFFLDDRPTGYFPTYIRGSVASEMDALYHGKPAFLVDALTSSGMSGSPVFATGQIISDATALRIGTTPVPPFVGIYSGRLTEVENGARRELQVGVIWRRELILQTVEYST